MMPQLQTVERITLEGKEESDADKAKYAEWERKTNAFLDQARGVIHVGANVGQERKIYGERDLPVIWIEPLAGVYERLVKNIRPYPYQMAYQYLLTDKMGADYRVGISNNGAQSSSILDFKHHRELWPEVEYVAAMDMQSVTLEYVIERHKIDLVLYDALILDVQGAELLVLQGAGKYLNEFNWIRAEVADFEIYEGCCELKDLDAYLTLRGFERVNLWPGAGKPGLGYSYEALYRRTDEEYR